MKFIKRLIILSGEKNKGTLTFERNAYGVFVKLSSYGAPLKDAYLSMVIDGKRFGNPATEAQFSLKGLDTVEVVHAAVFAADKLSMYGTNDAKRMPAGEVMRLKPAQKKPSAASVAAKGRDAREGEIFSGRKEVKHPQSESVKTEYIQAENSRSEYSDDAIAESNYYPPLKEDINTHEITRGKTRLKLFNEPLDAGQDLDEPLDKNMRAEILRRVAAAAQAGASPVIETFDSSEAVTAQIGDMLKEFGADLSDSMQLPQIKEFVKDDERESEMQENVTQNKTEQISFDTDKAVQENTAEEYTPPQVVTDEYITAQENKSSEDFKDGINTSDQRSYPCALAFSYIMNQSNSVKLSPLTGGDRLNTEVDAIHETLADSNPQIKIGLSHIQKDGAAQNFTEAKKMTPDQKQDENQQKPVEDAAQTVKQQVPAGDAAQSINQQKSVEDTAQTEKKNSNSIKNKKSEKVAPISGDKRVKARGGTFYERNGEEIERLFSGEREKELENLLPNSKWVKIDYNGTGKYYVIGLIGKEYLCYGVPATYTPVPPKELNGYCWWFPIKPQEPQGKGYWIMYQNLTTGEAVFPPKE